MVWDWTVRSRTPAILTRACAALLALALLASTAPVLFDGLRPRADPFARDLSLAAATLGSGLAVAAAGRWMPTALRWAVLPLPFVAGIAWVKTSPSLTASAVGTLGVATMMALCYAAPAVTWLVRRRVPVPAATDLEARRTRTRIVAATTATIVLAYVAATARAIPDAAASGILGVYAFLVLIVAAWPVLVLGGWAFQTTAGASPARSS